MEDTIDKLFPRYDWENDFEELLEDIEDVIFLMKCRYKYEDYSLRQVTQHYQSKYNMEELYVINEEQEYQDLLKQIEEVNLDEVMMNIESIGSNNQARPTQTSSTSGTGRAPATLTSIE